MREGWRTVKLGEFTEVKSGGTPSRSNQAYWGSDIPWYSSGELNTVRTSDPERHISLLGLSASTAKLFPCGSLLIGMYDTAALKMSILDRDGAFNQAIAGVKPNPGICLRFVMEAINYAKAEILRRRRGVRQKNLNLSKIKDIEIPLPPLPEQHRIVAILDKAFQGIATATANAEKNLKNARELFESYLQAVFTQKGEKWVETTLGKEINLLTGFAFKSKDYTEASSGIPLLRGDNITQGVFRWENVKKWSEHDTDTYEKYSLNEGDVVLAMDRTWVNAGLKYAQVSTEDLPCLLVQRVARLRANNNLSSRFLKYLLGSSQFTQYVLSIQTGIGVPHISGKQISDFTFGKPPILDQHHIVSQLDALSAETERLKSIYQQKLAALAELKQSLLQKAFSGELTAESASTIKEEALA